MSSIEAPCDSGHTRRSVLICGATAASFLLAGSCGGSKPASSEKTEPGAETDTQKIYPKEFDQTLEGRVSALAAGLQGVRVLGAAYLKSSMGRREGEPEELLAALIHSLRGFDLTDDVTLEQRIAALVAADFEADNVLFLDSWSLSVTECRLAGLSVLLVGEPEPQAREDDPLTGVPLGEVVSVDKWGPKTVMVGAPDHLKQFGHFAMWFQIPGTVRNLKFYVGGWPAQETYGNNLVTIAISGSTFDQLFSAPARYEVFVLDLARGVKQRLGEITVQ